MTLMLAMVPVYRSRADQEPVKPKTEEPQPITNRTAVEKSIESKPLTEKMFGNFRFPVINDKGDVVIMAMFPKGNQKFGQSVFIHKADGTWEVIREGIKAVNLDEPVHSFSAPAFNNLGELTFVANYGDGADSGAGPIDPNDPIARAPVAKKQGLFIKKADGLHNILKFGDEVPAMPSYFSGISNPSTSDKGTTAFIGTYTDPDGRGLFLYEAGKLKLVARSGQKISRNDESTFSEHYYPTQVNVRNEVAFLARVGDKSGVFIARPSGIEKLAFIGEPSPIKGANYLGFGNRTPSLNSRGEVAFAAFYDGPDAGRGLFVKGEGPVKVIAKSGDQITGTTYNFTDFASPAINSRGDIAFIGNFGGRNRGIFIKTAKGIIPIAMADQRIPGGTKDDVFNNFTPPSINDRGEVVFYGQWRTPATGVDIGIFHYDEKGVLKILVKRGDPMPEGK